MILQIGNGAILTSSSKWQLKALWKLNNSVQELLFSKLIYLPLTETLKNCTITYP